MMVVILEFGGYLLPEILILCLYAGIYRSVSHKPVQVMVSRVMVDVNDAVHAVVDDIIDDLVYSFHKCIIHLAVGIHLLKPCDRYADGTDARLLHHLHQFGLCDRLAPTLFMFRG